MRVSRKTKNVFKTVICAVLCVGAIIGCMSIFGGGSKSDDDFKRVRPDYSVGELNQTGKYVESKLSVYTKEAIECEDKGVKITPVFDSNINYTVFYYDKNGAFVSSESKTPADNMLDASEGVPVGACSFRIMITPVWEDTVKEADKELGFLDTYKYAKQLIVEVTKDTVRPSTSESPANFT